MDDQRQRQLIWETLERLCRTAEETAYRLELLEREIDERAFERLEQQVAALQARHQQEDAGLLAIVDGQNAWDEPLPEDDDGSNCFPWQEPDPLRPS